MTCPFGEVRQLGFISKDIDRSMAYFVDAWGIGPWFVLRGLASKMLYNGNSIDLDLSIAMANNGELQFEIVQQNNEVRSMYSDALAQCPELHLQHVAVWSDSVVADLPPSEWPNFYFRNGREGGMEWQGSTNLKTSLASCVKRRSCWRMAGRLQMHAAGSVLPNRATTAGAGNMEG